LAQLQALKAEEWESLFDGADALDVKEAAVLNKYFIGGMSLLTKKDTKASNMVNYPMLLKGQIKMNLKFGQAVIFKSLFEKNTILGGKSE
jgi:hypothetical protein